MIYSSWSDLKTREVTNNVWLVFGPLAFFLTLIKFWFFPPLGTFFESMVIFGVSLAVTSVFSLSLFYLGAYGGADAKAFICIALALPLPPHMNLLKSRFEMLVFPITVFSNGVIIAAFSAFYALLRNFVWRRRTGRSLFEGYENESFGRKALALLCGYKISVADLKNSFYYPLEDFHTTQEGLMKKRLLLFPKDEDREEVVERIVKARARASEDKPQNNVWVTPGLPMLVFVTVGLILALTVGDIVWIVLTQFLK